MTTRTVAILAAALAVLVLLAFYGGRDGAPPSRSGELLFPTLEASLDEIDRVRVVGAGAETLATLERGAERWTVTEKDGYPADIAKIRNALVGLAEARIVEQKTANPDYYARLGVDPVESEDARGLAVTAFSGETPTVSVIVGDAESGRHYVRAVDQQTSYLIDRQIDVPRDGTGWTDPTIIDVPSTRIASVSIEHADGATLRVSKSGADQTNFTVEGVPEGRELSYAGVANTLANTLRDLRFDDVAAANAPSASSDAVSGPTGEPEGSAAGDAVSGGVTGDDEAPDTAMGSSAARATFRTFDGLVVDVRARESDGESWIELEAGTESPTEERLDNGADAGESAPADELDSGDAVDSGAADAERVAAEAEAMNSRVRGWRFRIPSYQLDQLTRRMEDMLQPVDPDAE